jgi:hypothetical protein
MTKDLQSDEYFNDYYQCFCYFDTICPKCGAPDCCNLVYEEIEDALKRVINN